MTTVDAYSAATPKLAQPAQSPGWKSRLMRGLARRAPASLLSTQGPPRGRTLALTFDDGPDSLTGQYLERLSELGVVATFFLVGKNAQARPQDVRAIMAGGHEIAGHGFTHTPFPDLDRKTLREELEKTQRLFPPSRSARTLVRPPQGRVSARSLALTALAGYSTILWSVDSDDCRTSSAADIAQRLAPERLQAGDNILLHEGQPWTLEALPLFIPPLKRAGFSFVTVSELLAGQAGA